MDRVGWSRRSGGTLEKAMRPGPLAGVPPGMPDSTRSANFKTTPSLAASTVACSAYSTPVTGCVRITRTGSPTDFSSSLAGVSRSKSKFCSSRVRRRPSRLRSSAVSGCMRADTSRQASRFSPAPSLTRRASFTRARSPL
jgi:hypothetical protein